MGSPNKETSYRCTMVLHRSFRETSPPGGIRPNLNPPRLDVLIKATRHLHPSFNLNCVSSFIQLMEVSAKGGKTTSIVGIPKPPQYRTEVGGKQPSRAKAPGIRTRGGNGQPTQLRNQGRRDGADFVSNTKRVQEGR